MNETYEYRDGMLWPKRRTESNDTKEQKKEESEFKSAELSEYQKHEFESKMDFLSHAYQEQKFKYKESPTIPNSNALMLIWAVGILGYKFIKNGKREILGVEFETYKLVEA